MSVHLRRFLLACFVLLQGMLPLLHAHGAGVAHGGVHLPVWTGGEGAHLDRPGWHAEGALPGHAAIGVASSLQPRQDSLAGEASGPPGRAVVALPNRAGIPIPLLSVGRLAPPLAHFLPFACAPPHA